MRMRNIEGIENAVQLLKDESRSTIVVRTAYPTAQECWGSQVEINKRKQELPSRAFPIKRLGTSEVATTSTIDKCYVTLKYFFPPRNRTAGQASSGTPNLIFINRWGTALLQLFFPVSPQPTHFVRENGS